MTFHIPYRLRQFGGGVLAVPLAGFGAPAVYVGSLDSPGVPRQAELTAPYVITITARDHAFDAPDSVPAGITTINLVNRGPDLHQAQLVKLAPGKTVADVQKILSTGGSPPAWLTMAGGPNVVAAGHQSSATLDLAPGSYAIVCFVLAPDGQSYARTGMVRQLTVTAARTAAAFPKADVTLTLLDGGFTSSTALAPGRRVIRVTNAAPQPHELVLVKLAPGSNGQGMLEWLEQRQGPPPGELLGGVSGIAPNGTQQFAVDLQSGEYAYLCRLPGTRDGKPRAIHGVISQFTVGRAAATSR